MAKVLTFSRQFPAYHPRAGQPTYFVEQVLNSLGIDYHSEEYLLMLFKLNRKLSDEVVASFFMETGLLYDPKDEKPHTIRSGYRFKQGEMASLRVWSGKPYNSPQIIFAPDIEVKKTYRFQTWGNADFHRFFELDGAKKHPYSIEKIAKNDGLTWPDFRDWFKFPSDFDGQIICWKDPGY